MTQPANNAAPVAAPVKAPEVAANTATPAKAQWINSIDLNYNVTAAVWNAPDNIENCLLRTAGKVVCAVTALFAGVLETLYNIGCGVINGVIWAANGVHSLFETEEAPAAPVKPVEKPVEQPAQVPVAHNAPKKIVIPKAIPRMTIVKDFATSHKAGLITAPVAGTASGLAASYLLGLGAIASTFSGLASAAALGFAANYIANRKSAAPAVALAAAPVAAAPAAPVAVKV